MAGCARGLALWRRLLRAAARRAWPSTACSDPERERQASSPICRKSPACRGRRARLHRQCASAAQGGKLAEAAKAALEAANNKEKPVTGEALRRLLAKAALLDSAAANVGQSDGSVAALAIERLHELHQADVKAWSEKLPQLKTKLDLVLRDQSLEQAVAAVAKAAGDRHSPDGRQRGRRGRR